MRQTVFFFCVFPFSFSFRFCSFSRVLCVWTIQCLGWTQIHRNRSPMRNTFLWYIRFNLISSNQFRLPQKDHIINVNRSQNERNEANQGEKKRKKKPKKKRTNGQGNEMRWQPRCWRCDWLRVVAGSSGKCANFGSETRHTVLSLRHEQGLVHVTHARTHRVSNDDDFSLLFVDIRYIQWIGAIPGQQAH